MVFCANQFNLDGIDVDWEYPRVGAEADNFLLMMQELSAAMHKQGKLCTIAVVGAGRIGESIVKGVFDTVDYLMIMAYDANRYQHSTYEEAVKCMDYWKGRGLPANKAILGVPFYARDSTAEYKTAKYKEVLTRGGSPNNDTYQTVGYNGIPTIKKKTELAFAQGGGIMIWELDGDPIGPNSLLSAINEVVVSKRPSGGGRRQQ
jgi:GH18 family chitinase